MWKVSLESLGLKHWYSKITTSSIITNARLQQVTFTCLLKNHKMLPGYHPFFLLVSQSYNSFKRFTSRLLKLPFSLSMHLLPRMNVMLHFIWTLSVQLRGTRKKWTLQKNLVHGRIWTTNTARPPDNKPTALTTRPHSLDMRWN